MGQAAAACQGFLVNFISIEFSLAIAIRDEYIEPDESAIAMLGVRPMHGNFVNITDLVRHEPQKLAATIFRLVAKL